MGSNLQAAKFQVQLTQPTKEEPLTAQEWKDLPADKIESTRLSVQQKIESDEKPSQNNSTLDEKATESIDGKDTTVLKSAASVPNWARAMVVTVGVVVMVSILMPLVMRREA